MPARTSTKAITYHYKTFYREQKYFHQRFTKRKIRRFNTKFTLQYFCTPTLNKQTLCNSKVASFSTE